MKKYLDVSFIIHLIFIPVCFMLAIFSLFGLAAFGELMFSNLLYSCLGLAVICGQIYDGSIGAENSAAGFSLLVLLLVFSILYFIIFRTFFYPKMLSEGK